MIDNIKYRVRVLPVMVCTGRHGTEGLPFPRLKCIY